MSETASDQEARCALRQALRENYKKTRDNFGALEESLRFYNQASQILNDPQRRRLYDKEWTLSQGSSEKRIDFVVQEIVGDNPNPNVASLPPVEITGVVDLSPKKKPSLDLELLPESDMDFRMPPPKPAERSAAALAAEMKLPKVVFQEAPISGIEVDVRSREQVQTAALTSPPEDIPQENKEKPTLPVKQHYHPVLTENIGHARSLIFVGLSSGLVLLLVVILFYMSWGYVASSFEITRSWVWGVLLLIGFLFYNFGVRQGMKRTHKNYQLPGEPDDEAIKSWRRKRTIFLGSNYLAEDSSWVFQLRLTELERARVQRTSYISPWRRALARMFDYAFWGWLLIFPLSELVSREALSPSILGLIENPLIAPIVITATWIPIEALLMAAVGTTLGKWLFGVYVQFRVSNPYAPRDSFSCWRYAFARAFRVWWQGMALGFLPLLAFVAARSQAMLERFEETSWDDDHDVLVTHTPIRTLSFFVGVIGLAMLSFLYIAAWQKPLTLMGVRTTQLIAEQMESWQKESGNGATPSPSATLPGVNNGAQPRPIDPEQAESERRLAEFRDAIVKASEESRTLLDHKEWQRAYESCQQWARLEIANPAPLRCQGDALQAMDRHQEAISAYRNAKLYAPEDRSIDAAIQLSQEKIFQQLNR
ncbi:MAG: hypothetical protein LBS40_04950 [Burkholderiales bacterium]|nr:hypothetical protein [Burkholderiales bacterium]